MYQIDFCELSKAGNNLEWHCLKQELIKAGGIYQVKALDPETPRGGERPCRILEFIHDDVSGSLDTVKIEFLDNNQIDHVDLIELFSLK